MSLVGEFWGYTENRMELSLVWRRGVAFLVSRQMEDISDWSALEADAVTVPQLAVWPLNKDDCFF